MSTSALETITAEPGANSADRVLLTVLMTDIVGSTARAIAEGDRRWRRLVESHDLTARRTIAAFGGRYVKSLGDGLLATFDSPTRAIACAQALRDALATMGLSVRAGVHTGEIELIGDDVAGIAVNIAARVCSVAQADEILVSGIVCELALGSDSTFVERGPLELRGLPKRWTLYAVQ